MAGQSQFSLVHLPQACQDGFPSIIITGPSNTGKSTAVRSILRALSPTTDRLVVLCCSGRTTYNANIPDAAICTDFDEGIERIRALFEAQKRDFNEDEPDKCRAVVLVDDTFNGDKARANHKLFAELFTQGRHQGITVIVVQHAWRMIGNRCRTSCTLAVLTKTRSRDEVEVFSQEMLGGDMGKPQFRAIASRVFAVPFRHLVVDKRNDHNGVTSMIGFSRSPAQLPHWRFGTPRFKVSCAVFAFPTAKEARQSRKAKQRESESPDAVTVFVDL